MNCVIQQWKAKILYCAWSLFTVVSVLLCSFPSHTGTLLEGWCSWISLLFFSKFDCPSQMLLECGPVVPGTYCKPVTWGFTLRTSSRMWAPYGPMRLRLRLSSVTSDMLLFRAPARLSRRSSVRSVFLRTSCSTSSDVLRTVIMASSYSYKTRGNHISFGFRCKTLHFRHLKGCLKPEIEICHRMSSPAT